MNAIFQSTTSAVRRFWEWFNEHHRYYFTPDSPTAGLESHFRTDLLSELRCYCDELDFDILKTDGARRQLIITANGNKSCFKTVDILVSGAPSIFGWDFISLKPAVFSHFTDQWSTLKLHTREMWFLPLSYDKGVDLEIKVCLKDYHQIKENYALTPLLHRMLANIVGERSFALDIDHVYTDQLPPQPNSNGLWPILELSEYTGWFRSKQR